MGCNRGNLNYILKWSLYIHFKHLASYQRYKEIKKTVEATSDSSSKSSESLTSTSIDVWGKDLNKATPGDKNAAPVSVANKGSSSVMKGLGKKILQNSLLLKVRFSSSCHLYCSLSGHVFLVFLTSPHLTLCDKSANSDWQPNAAHHLGVKLSF